MFSINIRVNSTKFHENLSKGATLFHADGRTKVWAEGQTETETWRS